jgi:large subunit ribosomal protein L19
MKASCLTKETVLDVGVKDRKFPDFRVGDNIEVSILVKEGKRERSQIFRGDVISFHKKGISTTFTVRRIASNGIGVEKIFPYYSPVIGDIKVVKCGVVRRAKLFYVRDRIGKAARIKERVLTKKQKQDKAAQSKVENSK